MGGDSAGSTYDTSYIQTAPKVFLKSEKMLIGFVGSFRLGQVLQYSLRLPLHSHHYDNNMQYLVDAFIPELIKEFKACGIATVKDEFVYGLGEFLVGYNGELFSIDHEFQVLQNETNFMCTGSGEDFAYGTMFGLSLFQPVCTDIEQRIKLALKTSAYYSKAIREPFTILKMGYK
jgi:ATP-dependent protease HslVU (ClpYQ) peptidase subunit